MPTFVSFSLCSLSHRTANRRKVSLEIELYLQVRGTHSKVHRGGCTLVLSPDGQTGSAPHGAAAWRWRSWALACVCMRGLVHTGGWLFPKACELVLRYHRRMTGSQRRYFLPIPYRRINNNL